MIKDDSKDYAINSRTRFTNIENHLMNRSKTFYNKEKEYKFKFVDSEKDDYIAGNIRRPWIL